MSALPSWHPAKNNESLPLTDAGGCSYQPLYLTGSGHALLPTSVTPCPRHVGRVGLCGRSAILAGIVLIAGVVAVSPAVLRKPLIMRRRPIAPVAKYMGWSFTTTGVKSITTTGVKAVTTTGVRSITTTGDRSITTTGIKSVTATSVKSANPAATCPDAEKLSIFSSRENMERAGWRFGWDDGNTFKPMRSNYGRNVSNQSYWGFSSLVDAEIALVLHGQGQLTLDFGNSYNKKWSSGAGGSVSDLSPLGLLGGPIRMLETLQSKVSVFLNGEMKGRASMGTPSIVRRIPFKSGDVLRLVETNGVIVINSIAFHCASNSPGRSGTAAFSGHPFTSSTTSIVETTATREAVAVRADAGPLASISLDAEDLPVKNEWLAVKQRETDVESDRQQALALPVERLKHRVQRLRRSESAMAAKLARTAKQLQALQKEELQEIRAAKAEKDRQKTLLRQINNVSSSSSVVTSEVIMRYSK